MSRDLTAAAAAVISGSVVYPIIFYEGEFSTGMLRLWSGVGSIDWDGQTWTGAGHMLGIAPIEETSEIRASAFYVSLSGEATAILSANLGAARNGLPGKVWIGFLDSSKAIIADPFLAFSGRFDVPEILDEGERATIQARYESRLIDLDRARIRRYTSEDQKLDYPADLGFEFIPALQNVPIIWGRPSPPGSSNPFANRG